VGPTWQHGREREEGTGSGFGFPGRGLFHLLGRKVPPEALFYFYFIFFFSFSVFLISFVSFAKMLQI
jgi:hypothetical protein